MLLASYGYLTPQGIIFCMSDILHKFITNVFNFIDAKKNLFQVV